MANRCNIKGVFHILFQQLVEIEPSMSVSQQSCVCEFLLAVERLTSLHKLETSPFLATVSFNLSSLTLFVATGSPLCILDLMMEYIC